MTRFSFLYDSPVARCWPNTDTRPMLSYLKIGFQKRRFFGHDESQEFVSSTRKFRSNQSSVRTNSSHRHIIALIGLIMMTNLDKFV